MTGTPDREPRTGLPVSEFGSCGASQVLLMSLLYP